VLLRLALGLAAGGFVSVTAPDVAIAQRSLEASAGVRSPGKVEQTPLAVDQDSGRVALAPTRASLRGSLGRDDAQRLLRSRWAPAGSALLPGTGQWLLDQDRFIPYLALEAYAWLKYASDSREGARQRAEYRRLARTVARAQFATSTPNGNWEYYERMEHYTESGVYDAIPGGALQPEPDTTTFNGSVWLLARETYWEDPNTPPDPGSTAYTNALVFYSQRAVTPNYRWSWRDAQLEQDLFRRTIARSNDFYRQAAQDLAVVIANHVLSTVDSYVTVRLRSRRGVGRGTAVGSGSDDGYDLTLRVPLPRR
jgi:hypothetical protein